MALPVATAKGRWASFVLELASGRMMDFVTGEGFPTVHAMSSRCVDIEAVGKLSRTLRTVPRGRYCLTAEGKLAAPPIAP